MPQSAPTLFDKYGGVPAVRALVRQFHERFAASPTLRRYFENVDTEKFIQHHAELIAYTLGRPAPSFDPHKMSEQHHPRDISASSFEQVVGILRQVLLDANIEGRDIAQILHRLDQQRHRIVRDVPPLHDVYHPEQVDSLTGLGNQDALLLAIQHECQRYQQERLPCSLALIRATAADRDALPTDPQGVHMLQRHLAGALSRTARRADVLCRREDGVFALVLRATDQGKGLQAARRIHASVARNPFMTATSKQGIALLIGLAACGGSLSTPEDLVQAAERALERAGQSGQMIVIG